jgi:galactose mutarotase-like enzyme
MKNTISNAAISFVSDSFNVEPWALYFNDDEVNYVWHCAEGETLGAAVCFPLLGSLPDNKYELDGKEYMMGMHGFAQYRNFTILKQTEDTVIYEITDNDDSYAQYPWHFSFQVVYSLEGTSLKTQYRVRNSDKKKMYFSVGGHPRYACPIGGAGYFENYTLVFDKPETIQNIVKSYGPIRSIQECLSSDGRQLDLNYRMFDKGCFCLHPLNSDYITLQTAKTSRALKLGIAGVSHFQLWTTVGAEYIALEPWYGSITSIPCKKIESKWQERPGTLCIQPGEEYICAYFAHISK